MIELKTAKRHVESFRFANLDFAPDTEGALTLAKMLGKHALSDEHAGAVVSSWIAHWPKWPRPSDIKQFCEVTPDPRMAQDTAMRLGCPRCQGNGYISVAGPFGTSAAYPCTHQAETESDRRMGVRISPAIARRYSAQAVEADSAQVEFLQKRLRGELKGFGKVTQGDVDSLIESLGI